MEAAIWKKPLIIISKNKEDIMVPQYLEEGIGIFANSVETFSKQLHKIISNYSTYQQNCKNFTDKQLAYHGTAVDRILQVIN